MSHGFVQVPPQSTGKKIATEERTEINYDNATGIFTVGDVVTGATSGATGTVTAVFSDTVTIGILYLRDVTGTFSDNENLQVSSATIAIANFTTYPQSDYAIQKVVISDPENLGWNQKIDRFGATLNTFSDGSPVFGSFGSMAVGEPYASKTYSYQYNNQAALFWDRVVGAGATVHESALSSTNLSTTTASGDKITRTSNFYHPYYPGVGNELLMAMQIGDTGKTNVVRRWGLFDDDNGLFWQLSGTTLSVVVRTNTSGSPVDTVINQTNFNLDRLDGTNGLNLEVDVTLGNIFWIDYQWLGTGRARFGVYEPGGAKLVAHVIENANKPTSFPYMATGTLPFRLEQENIGTAISASEMRSSCAVLRHSSKVILDGNRHSDDSGIKTVALASGEIPIFSARPKTTFGGKPNRAFFKGRSFNIVNLGTEAVRVRILGGSIANLTGSAFAEHASGSILELDTTATALVGAGPHSIVSYIIPANGSIFVQNVADDDAHNFELYLGADGTTQTTLIMTAECLTGTTTNIIATVNWEESKG
jgi:hypothetical protein